MKRDIKLFVKDIISAMDSIEKFVSGMTIDEIQKDDKTSSAVIRKFEIIGEATKHIPDALRIKHSEIPWSRMSGMRDRLVHAYLGIDYRLVWDAIKIDIPNLKPKFERILVDL
ncbi:MAG: DUF86 domain-containing protein [Promethearchaeati archaeon SRVP18_Atabeyarchaeia-1]